MIFKLLVYINFKILVCICYEIYNGINEKYSYDSESGILNVGYLVQKKIVFKDRKI